MTGIFQVKKINFQIIIKTKLEEFCLFITVAITWDITFKIGAFT